MKMNFKNCNVIYYKTHNLINDIHLLRGKIIISDFQEFNKICNLYGIIHILNQNDQKIPEYVDCIISNSRNIELESRLKRNNMNIPIIYTNMKQKWCGICGNLSPLNDSFNKYCSPECMQKSIGFNNKGIPESIKDLSTNIELFPFKLNSRNSNTDLRHSSKSKEKIQKSVLREARRIEYAYKKEDYKKSMRQPSQRKTKITSNHSDKEESKQCKSFTKGGKERCKNKSLTGSDFCGIPSHNQ